MSAVRSLLNGILDVLSLLQFCGDASQHAVHELRGFIFAAEILCQINGLVDCNGDGDLFHVHHLVAGQAQDGAIDGGHAVHGPVLRIRLDMRIQLRKMLRRAPHQEIGVLRRLRFVDECIAAFQQRYRRFVQDIALIQNLDSLPA